MFSAKFLSTVSFRRFCRSAAQSSNAISAASSGLMFYAAAVVLALTFGNNATANQADPAPSVSQIPFGAAKSTQPLSQIEREWLNARAAFERRDIAALETAKERFGQRSDFVLAPYVRYWWISAQLAQSAQFARTLESDIIRFSTENGDAPFADQLRRDYLRALGKLESWSQFGQFQAAYTGDDNEVACQRLRYRFQLGGTDRSGAIADARNLLLTSEHSRRLRSIHRVRQSRSSPLSVQICPQTRRPGTGRANPICHHAIGANKPGGGSLLGG